MLRGAWLLAASLAGTAAWAQVTVNEIVFPANIGRGLDATVSINYIRTTAAAATISVALPAQLTASAQAPASGCVLVGSPATQVDCTVPAGSSGDTGTLSFDVQGAVLGGFSLNAIGTGGSTATNPGTVQRSGEITLSQARTPTGNVLAGQTLVFTLAPAIAAGADDLPAGAFLTLTAQLPGLASDFILSAIGVSGASSGNASCSSVASANSSRSVVCTLSGPLTRAQVNALVFTITGTAGTTGSFFNVGSIAADGALYFDQNPNNNTASVGYTVDSASDLQAQGSFPQSTLLTGTTQTLTLGLLNNGPLAVPAGATVGTVVPAGFTVNSLPAGCSGPATGVVLATATPLSCTAGALNAGAAQGFALSLTMPSFTNNGIFVVSVAPAPGWGDANGTNNSLNLNYAVVAPVGPGQALVTVVAESSLDGSTWVDSPAAAPIVTGAATQMFWRIRISTPSAPPQQVIPTLNLSDTLPGIVNATSPGAPAPGYQTPLIPVTTQVTAGSASGGCPAGVAAGTAQLDCSFTAVAPGTSIEIIAVVSRPFFSAAQHLNTATVSSTDAVLTGTLSDGAALVVYPRVDVAATSITVTPATPRVGQTLQFTLTAQNLGPDQNDPGEFVVIDDLNTSTAAASVAYGDITATASGMACVLTGSAAAGEPALAAGYQRVRCTSTSAVARYEVRSIVITARVLKPATLPASGNAYTAQTNTQRVLVPATQCEWKSETSTNPLVSSSCSDGSSTSNNSASTSFDVLLPLIDLQQRKTRVLPGGQSSFFIGQPLRYRFRIQNNGPARAEGVVMRDALTVPAGFTLTAPVVLNINGVGAEAGFTLDTSKAGTVSCSQAAANADVVCVLDSTAAGNTLESGREVNFEVELTQTGSSSTPVTFSNQALVCGDESAAYETVGACNRTAAGNNNLAAANDTIFPRTDLAITKSTLTAQPVAINQPVVFQLVLRNLGDSATQQVRVQDVLPANFELVTSGADAPSLALGSFVTAAPSSATGATLACTPTPAAISAAGQSQTVDCVVNATPGPLGSGAFPGGSNAANTITLRLVAVPKAGFFTGPYLSDRSNTASVSPGLDSSGNPLSIDTVPGNNSSSSVTQVAKSSLAGRVFNDRDGNGVQDGSSAPQDEGIGNVLITLTGSDSFGNAISRNTTTLNSVGATRGDYLFDDLPPGSYSLTQTQPAGYVNSSGTPPAPSAGGSYTAAASASTSAYGTVTLPAATAATGYNFPEQLPGAVIAGTVFNDRDRDGSQGAGEPGIPGVTLGLYPAGTACPASGALPPGALQTVLSDASGGYAFAAATSGNAYVVCEQQPASHGDRPPVPGAGNTTPGANQINLPSLPAAGSAGNNFPETLASLRGTVFVDVNPATPATSNNGVQNPGEPGLGSATAGAGVPVTLSGTLAATGTAIAPQTVTTAADGSFSFDDLATGSYTLAAGAVPAALGSFADGINSAGAVSGGGTAGAAGAVGDNAIRNIGLPAGTLGSGNTFAKISLAQVSGSVFNDANNDGQRQPGEVGYAGQTLALTGTDDRGQPVSLGTTTDANGDFAFSGLRPGNYTLTQPVQPAGTVNGTTTPGSTGGTATAVATTPSAISGISLAPGVSSSANLFGERGNSPDLVVTKLHAPATFTELNPGSYSITVRNLGELPTSGAYTVTDTLPAGMTAVAGTATAPNPRGSGWVCSVAGQVVSCSSSDPIAAGGANPNAITLDVTVARSACSVFPCTLDNVVSVAGGGELAPRAPTPAELANPPACTTPLATQNACRRSTPVQQSGGITGTVWLDVDHDRQMTAPDVRIPGFGVELYHAGALLRSTSTDARGDYLITGLVPGNGYEVRFRDPVSGTYYGRPISADPAGGNDPAAFGPASVVPGGSIQNISVPGGNAVRVQQSLPLDPNGVVYDSATRQPVAGALVELLGPNGDPVPSQCVLGGINRITTPGAGSLVPGGYAFWLVTPQPAGCAGDGAYQLRVTPPSGYLNAGRPSDGSAAFTSTLIPAAGPLALVPGSCQTYVAGGACPVQLQNTPPAPGQPAPYYFRLPLTPGNPQAFVDIVNNHIPLDPFGGTRFVITKQATSSTAEVGDPVRYTIVVRHVEGPGLPNVRVDDSLPAGFRYIPGSFRMGGNLQADPAGSPGPQLSFPLGTLPVNGSISFTYVLRVGVGAQQGDGINSAQGVSVNGAQQIVSNVAKSRVKVSGGVFGNDSCVVGKVFVDCNGNQVQDREELGIPGVRMVLLDGTGITTDSEGKYSFCGLPPRTQVLKVDPLTLPRGSRLVTSSSRNAGDANSIFLDLRNGELQRADFIEGSCSNTVLEQVKARRAQGEVRAVETEKKGGPALKFEGKAPGYPQQGTDSANQPAVKPREPAPEPTAPVSPSQPEQNTPVPKLPAASQNTQRK
jgi:uncharacterized repeat protein (TIGR01451 family)